MKVSNGTINIYLIIFGMLTIVNVIYKKVFYPELKEVDKEPDKNPKKKS